MLPNAASPASPIQGYSERAEGPLHILSQRHKVGRALRLALIAAALAGAVYTKIPLCPFAFLTRHPCPGCGLTRASIAMIAGDVHTAAHLHPLVFLVTPIIAIMFGYNSYSYVRFGKWFASERFNSPLFNAAWIIIGALMIALWIARFFGAFGGPVPV
ncbi:MAG: DUF2752 domain-containing protein [Polyangiaceae bacterium]|nr:DUF2752 domain-containing protein [Polyangiaceae bacterium]